MMVVAASRSLHASVGCVRPVRQLLRTPAEKHQHHRSCACRRVLR